MIRKDDKSWLYVQANGKLDPLWWSPLVEEERVSRGFRDRVVAHKKEGLLVV